MLVMGVNPNGKPSIYMKRFYAIYDASWLMNPKGLWYANHMPEFVNYEKTVIAFETRLEIEKHLSNPEKANLARGARALCAKYMSWPSFEEVRLSSIPRSKVLDYNNLGPDSSVDKKIVDLAYKYAHEDEDGFVFVLTWDGGIGTALALLNSQFKLPIFSPTSLNQFLKFIGGTRVTNDDPKYLM